MSTKPIDTSTLGPIRVDMNSDRIRAKIVREALSEAGKFARTHESVDVNTALRVLSMEGSDALLSRLGRLLK